MQGRKPHSGPSLRVIAGGPGQAPTVGDASTDERTPSKRKLTPFCVLHGDALIFWNRFVARAPWLTFYDEPLATMTAIMWGQFLTNPQAMPAAKISLLRALLSDIGGDPGTRRRLNRETRVRRTPASKFFDNGEPDQAI